MHSDTRSPKQRVLDCIAQFTAAPITEKARLQEQLSLERGDLQELATDLEEEFNIMFDEDEPYTGPEIDKWVTVADIINSVYRLAGHK